MYRGFFAFADRWSVSFARFSLFIIYFWFGAIKVFGVSAANPLVDSLLQKTLPFLTFNQFILGLGIFEMFIGILFLFPRLLRLALPLLLIHMITTIMPLILLPALTWQSFLTPTLEGQYIIKNILIIALAFFLASKQKSGISNDF